MATLSEPVLAHLVSIRFFNGRLLTGDDLTREQRAVYARDERIAAALGSGVVSGLAVARLEDAARLTVTVTAGQAINRKGVFLELKESGTFEFTPAKQAAPSRPAEWRPCHLPTTPLAKPPVAGLYLLSICPTSVDGTDSARVLQIDRSNDPCTVSHVHEAVVVRATRMDTLTQSLAGVDADRLRNVAAHRCFGTEDVPLDPADDAGDDARAIEALVKQIPALADDVPLAIVRIGDDGTIAWVDMGSARRRLVAPSTHDELRRTTGPRSVAEAEARLMQFQAQIDGSAPPTSGRHDLVGGANKRFKWLPPAGALPATWIEKDAWRDFFGAVMAPPAVRPCDPGLLPSLLAGAALSTAIPVGDHPHARPAIDVYVGRDPKSEKDVALVFVQSTQSRVFVELDAPKNVLTDSVVKHVAVRVVSADGLRSWEMVYLKDPQQRRWVSPNIDPGDYSIQVVSGVVAAKSSPTVHAVGGRVHRAEVAVDLQAGTIAVDAREGVFTKVYEVLATLGERTLEAEFDPKARRWIIEAALAGTWTVIGRARFRNSQIVTRSADVLVKPGQTSNVTLNFAEKVDPPPVYVKFKLDKQDIKLFMIETSITDQIDGIVREVRGFDYHEYLRAQAEPEKYAPKHVYAEAAVQNYAMSASEVVKIDGRSISVRKPVDTVENVSYAELRQWAAAVDVAKYEVVRTLPEAVRAWLDKWQVWLAYNEPGEAERAAILAATPALRLTAGTDLLSLAKNTKPAQTTEAWAVFGPTSLPVGVTREDVRMPVKHNPREIREVLEKYRKYPWPIPRYGIDEIGCFPRDILDRLIRWPAGGPDDPRTRLYERAELARDQRHYAITDIARERLGALSQTAVGIANAPLDALSKTLFDSFLAAEVQGAIRQELPAEKWSLAANLSKEQADVLAARGIVSLGDFALAAQNHFGGLDLSNTQIGQFEALSGRLADTLKGVISEDFTAALSSNAAVEVRTDANAPLSEGKVAIDLNDRAGAQETLGGLSPAARKAWLQAASKRESLVDAMTTAFGGESGLAGNLVPSGFVIDKTFNF